MRSLIWVLFYLLTTVASSQTLTESDTVYFQVHVFTLDRNAMKEPLIYWRSPEVGICYPPCFGTYDSYMRYLVKVGKGTLLTSPRLAFTLDNPCSLSLYETGPDYTQVGLELELSARRLEKQNVDLTTSVTTKWAGAPRKISTVQQLGDGGSVVFRGLGADKFHYPAAELCSIPVWGPLFQSSERERELLLMVTPRLYR